MENNQEKLNAGQKGDIVENRVAESIILGSNGRLTVYKPNSDIDGVDLIIKKRRAYKAIYIQVKSRYTLHADSIFIQDIQRKSFSPHKDFYLIFAYFDQSRQELNDYIWFVPSMKFKNLARELSPKGYQAKLRFQAPIDPLRTNKYSKFLINKTDLAKTLMKLAK